MKFSWEQNIVNSSDEFEKTGCIPMHWPIRRLAWDRTPLLDNPGSATVHGGARGCWFNVCDVQF